VFNNFNWLNIPSLLKQIISKQNQIMSSTLEVKKLTVAIKQGIDAIPALIATETQEVKEAIEKLKTVDLSESPEDKANLQEAIYQLTSAKAGLDNIGVNIANIFTPTAEQTEIQTETPVVPTES
jgi:hypothetical protein